MTDKFMVHQILQQLKEINDLDNIISKLSKYYDQSVSRKRKDLSGQPKS